MGDNFPALWLCLDGLCCRRSGRTGLSLMWWPKGEHNEYNSDAQRLDQESIKRRNS